MYTFLALQVIVAINAHRSARISILCSIIRVGNPSRKSTQIMYFTLAAFVAMYLALLGQRIHHCLVWSCRFLVTNVIAQLISECMLPWGCAGGLDGGLLTLIYL